MQTYEGSCHCGRIKFSFLAPAIKAALRCTCSICKRKGALLTNFTVRPENTDLETAHEYLSRYQFGTKVARHYFCNWCGVFTYLETRLNPGEYRFNLGCLDDLDPFALPVETFDGDSI